jgi:diguanylate cyclase (GGDEF)-like protein
VIPTRTTRPLVPRQPGGPAERLDRAVDTADVLVVDDDEAMAGTIVEVLGTGALDATAVTTGSAAITRAKELHPSVVVCDQRLPDMSGLELCAAIRAIDPDVSLILLTGHASLDSAIAAVGQIDQYLIKPAPPEELVQSVIAGAQRSAQRRRARAAAEREAELRRTLEEQLRQQALHDALTGLPNRALFVERAQHALARRHAHPMVVCFLDLDDFKDVNDSIGHDAGDELLRTVASRLAQCLRPADTVARFGGDEFAILLEETDLMAARAIAGRILSELARPVRVRDTELLVRASIGLAPTVERDTTPEKLLAEADMAMYAAKSSASRGVAVFDPSMRRDSEARSRLRTEIADALRRKEFHLVFQPIHVIGSGERVGVEALIRWHHPERGVLRPAEFLDHAELSGQITEIGEWVLRAACPAMATADGSSFLSVNISTRQLLQPEFVDLLGDVLSSSGLPPSRLVLELAETAPDADTERVIAQVGALKSLGVGFAVDDFGAGHSALTYLRRFPVDHLKIDRGFVQTIETSEADRAILRGVIGIAHALGLRAIAEGVETETQRDILAALGCDLAQGHLWSRALAWQEIVTEVT